MDLKTISTIVIALLAFIVAVGYRYYNPKADANDPVEKVCEAIIKEETGLDIETK